MLDVCNPVCQVKCLMYVMNRTRRTRVTDATGYLGWLYEQNDVLLPLINSHPMFVLPLLTYTITHYCHMTLTQ